MRSKAAPSLSTPKRRAYYRSKGVVNDCACADCRNFREAAPLLSERVKAFFNECGIEDPRFIIELTPYEVVNGKQLTGGIYQVAGSMDGGEPPLCMRFILFSAINAL